MNRFFKITMILLFALPCLVVAKGQVATSAEGSDAVSVVKQEQPAMSQALRRESRGIADIKTEFVPKGQWVFGGSVSYSTHTNNNYSFLIIEDIQSNGYQFKVTPLVGYAYSRNSLVGVRFGYSRGLTELDNEELESVVSTKKELNIREKNVEIQLEKVIGEVTYKLNL